MASNLTYKEAGVDINAGEELVERIKAPVKKTTRPEVIGGLGGFGALTRIPKGYTNPVLVTGTDGVGTKLRLAIDLQKDGNYEIWIRDKKTKENFCYYLFDYSFGIIEVW